MLDKEASMSYQERQTLMNMISTILITVLYLAYMMQRYPQTDLYSPEVFRFWGAFFLFLIPVSIVAKIIIYILFTILNAIATRDQTIPITDERDQLIETKANTISNYVFIVGFILAMGSLALNMPPVVMFVVLLVSGVVSSIVSEVSQFYFYRRGV
jgi:hypothetical protein